MVQKLYCLLSCLKYTTTVYTISFFVEVFMFISRLYKDNSCQMYNMYDCPVQFKLAEAGNSVKIEIFARIEFCVFASQTFTGISFLDLDHCTVRKEAVKLPNS